MKRETVGEGGSGVRGFSGSGFRSALSHRSAAHAMRATEPTPYPTQEGSGWFTLVS